MSEKHTVELYRSAAKRRDELSAALELLLATCRHCGEAIPRNIEPTEAHIDSVATVNLRSAIRAQNVLDAES